MRRMVRACAQCVKPSDIENRIIELEADTNILTSMRLEKWR